MPENTFKKLFYTLVCVWQYRKIRSKENHLHFYQKISHFECKIIYALILPSNNFWKPHLKRESLSSLLTLSKTHIQAHLNQALASPDCVAPLSKTHLQAYLQTIFQKKRTEPRARRESRADEIVHTTPDRTTTPNPRLHRSRCTPAPTRSHPSTCEIAPLEAPARSHP